jgi:carbon-nitrogen hydrolase
VKPRSFRVAAVRACPIQLCDAARRAGVAVAIGVNERNSEASGASLFNTLLYIGPDGTVLGKHRTVVPTGGERLGGNGTDLAVFTLPFSRVSSLICWENYMPLARHTLAAWGAQIHVVPTWDRGEPWLSTLRHVAKEGRAHKDAIPDSLALNPGTWPRLPAGLIPAAASWSIPMEKFLPDRLLKPKASCTLTSGTINWWDRDGSSTSPATTRVLMSSS